MNEEVEEVYGLNFEWIDCRVLRSRAGSIRPDPRNIMQCLYLSLMPLITRHWRADAKRPNKPRHVRRRCSTPARSSHDELRPRTFVPYKIEARCDIWRYRCALASSQLYQPSNSWSPLHHKTENSQAYQ